ncbi:DUF262 domain-containing protein [Riemerella anatipestifer]|uniref:DUF262 domain-containing protein n=2 Tax=Riemerella anatipestifer TaxID=34085 RepID=A0AAP3AN47_RIEAN|nr:DUF262 domain-containing protein [Riemerella anatipestifer]MBT0552408.1 DUF262 domain-containing protein [Riemerella anatipestifer]MBT0554719.1 DUF262 domain-containing protein [Riemerella anatipestifer]MCE3025193.1 DUF262 domain-containing protein [Riemerella anatipestifer]MCO7319770.1 DUF262 domain-containing protein [Riemerella anatipestifer]MCQ4156174.1 DUF262 domain-containing protein [Riemerella anatipestifer]
MSNILTFKQVFDSKVFRIPDYQRGYSWGNEQLEQLWSDLKNIHLHLGNFHFTGILTINNFQQKDYERIQREAPGYNVENDFVKIGNKYFKPYHLVDGQQRITTLLILLSELIKKLNENYSNDKLINDIINIFFKVSENSVNKYLFGYDVDVPSHEYLIGVIFEDSQMIVNEPETLYTQNLLRAKIYFKDKVEGVSEEECLQLVEKITNKLLFSVLNY